MNSAHGPASPASESTAAPHPRIVLLYDDFSTAVRGKALCDQLEARCNLDGALWRSDVLAIPEVRHEAATAALGAEIVVLSLRGDADLSATTRSWCEDWMPRPRDRDLTLIVLFDQATAVRMAMEKVRGYLQQAAHAAGIRFFGNASLTATVPFLGEPSPIAAKPGSA